MEFTVEVHASERSPEIRARRERFNPPRPCEVIAIT